MTYRMKANQLDFCHVLDIVKSAYEHLKLSTRIKRKAYIVATKNELLRDFVPIFGYLTVGELHTLTAACQLAETPVHHKFKPTTRLGIETLNQEEKNVYAKSLEMLKQYSDLVEMRSDAKWGK